MPDFAFETKQTEFVNAEGDPAPLRVITAKNQAQATAHYLGDAVTVRKATSADYMNLGAARREIEKAPS